MDTLLLGCISSNWFLSCTYQEFNMLVEKSLRGAFLLLVKVRLMGTVSRAVPAQLCSSLGGYYLGGSTYTLLCAGGVKWNWGQLGFKCASGCRWKEFFPVFWLVSCYCWWEYTFNSDLRSFSKVSSLESGGLPQNSSVCSSRGSSILCIQVCGDPQGVSGLFHSV